MKNKTQMKIISICFIFIMIFNMFGNIYAATNKAYGESTPVAEIDLEAKLKESIILEAIASLVYGLGSLVETLVGAVFEKLTGENSFPWADRVIFNTVAFLDVNFLNPESGSLFKKSDNSDTILAKIIRNTYYTVLTLAIGFLGIIVGVMAIRLAVSTIAAEKAKYKEAIGKFLISLVMLFCIHYAISFIFYLNESIVTIASTILLDNMQDVKLDQDMFAPNISDEQLIKNFFTAQGAGDEDEFEKQKDKVLSNPDDVKILKALIQSQTYKEVAIPKAYGNGKESMGEKINVFLHWDNKNAVDTVMESISIVKNDSKIEEYKKHLDIYNKTPEDYDKYLPLEFIEQAYKDVHTGNANDAVTKGTIDRWKESDPSAYKKGCKKAAKWYTDLIKVFIGANSIYHGNSSELKTDTIIAKMGEYFKESAWVYEEDEDGEIDGWSATQVSLQGALLYAIFVVQSMLFFIAYLKRFFFVTILALLAPAIVIYDFLGKAVM